MRPEVQAGLSVRGRGGPQDGARCVGCDRAALRPVLDVGTMPVHVGVLWPTREAAQSSASGRMVLAVCEYCGLVANSAFDAGLIDYSQKYDNALHGSPVFQRFEQSLVRHLADRYGLGPASTVVEVGCGSGHFLGLMCTETGAQGIGFDPSHDPAHVDPLAGGVRFIRGEFDARDPDLAFDLLVCRQTLEHIADPRAFLVGLHDSLAGQPDAVAYFDVPNSTMPFRDLSIWDLVYEHCLYFVESSLRHLLEAQGWEVRDLRRTFEGQFLSVEAAPSRRAQAPAQPETTGLLADLERFAAEFRRRTERWQHRLEEYRRRGQRAVVWGAGARAVSFFNLVAAADIDEVVDVNPRKQGSYLGGTGQRIVSPEALRASRPDVVIILNPLYASEIEASLSALGVPAAVVAA